MRWNQEPTTSFVILAFALLAPLLLTVRLRRLALRSSDQDRTAVWFNFFNSLRWTLGGSLVLWWATTDFVQLRHYTNEVSYALGLGGSTVGEVISLLLIWLPIFCVLVICNALAQPVYAGVRGLTWTRAELTKLSALRVVSSYIPLLLMVAGYRTLFRENAGLRDFLACFAAAFFIGLTGARYLRALLQLVPQAVTTGELRDRAFALAAGLGVKLRQLYLMPAGKMRMANAFASSAKTVLLTDYLLTQLNRREVDAILAHELAHLKHDHAQKRASAAGVMLVIVALAYSAYLDSPFRPVFDILAVAIPLTLTYFLWRRFELTADAQGAKLVGDPEALITGLVKVHALNLFPVRWGRWSERWMTHPSTVKRAEAIARATGLPLERIPSLLEAASGAQGATEGDRYPLPESALGEPKVFSTQFKQRTSWRISMAYLAAMSLLPSAAVLLNRETRWLEQGWAICLAALIPAASFCAILSNFLPFIGHGELRRSLLQKFERLGVRTKDHEGMLVGFSPGAAPRTYEMNYSWDIGLLFLAGQGLYYWGEEARFTLRREQVISVRLGSGIPGWLRAQSLYLTWRDEERGTNGTFNIRPADVCSLLQMRRAVHDLARRVEEWRDAARPHTCVPPSLAGLTAPSIGVVTGSNPRSNVSVKQLYISAIIVAFLTGGACLLFGLALDTAGLFEHILRPDEAGQTDLGALYAILAAWLALVFIQLPMWFYRDPKG